ncbi:hypothetical protein QJS04_geneDACA000807 [Acorus gramineus]|uniref:Reverse transcriptase domain-containing protein n=1 Tax=Acorus gramineus TaxID=55184 RepID=A0AAV9BEV5_ACOGR|nr:hypothetical protein QJS04_geneDACA000807 [Acorus gramineus]
MEMFEEFHSGQQGCGCLNATFIALIPKNSGADRVSNYRPISLLNSSYKIIAKVLASQLRSVLKELVDLSQSAFIQGRSLLDGFLIAQECVAGAHNSKRTSFLCKLDFEKAYDSVRWDFLWQLLKDYGFSSKQLWWLKECISTVKLSILVNGKAVGRMIYKGVSLGWIHGLEVTKGGSRVSHIQYADDTILLCDKRESNLDSFVFIIKCFGNLSVLKVNLNKSNLFGIHIPLDKIPVDILNEVDKIRRRFLWRGTKDGGSGPYLAKWDLVCRDKKDGGMGILNLQNMNKALLGKWLWRLIAYQDSLRIRVIREKYYKKCTRLELIPHFRDAMSKIWKDIPEGA